MNDMPSAQAADEGPDQHLLNFQIAAVYYALVSSFERLVGCTLARFRVLYAFGHAQELSQAWLQQQLELNSAAITRQVQAMEAEGLVVRRVQQRHVVVLGDDRAERVDRGTAGELSAVRRREHIPGQGFVVESRAQCRRRRDVLVPEVDVRPLLREPPRPEPIDQHAKAVGGRRRLVDAFDLQHEPSLGVPARAR